MVHAGCCLSVIICLLLAWRVCIHPGACPIASHWREGEEIVIMMSLRWLGCVHSCMCLCIRIWHQEVSVPALYWQWSCSCSSCCYKSSENSQDVWLWVVPSDPFWRKWLPTVWAVWSFKQQAYYSASLFNVSTPVHLSSTSRLLDLAPLLYWVIICLSSIQLMRWLDP